MVNSMLTLLAGLGLLFSGSDSQVNEHLYPTNTKSIVVVDLEALRQSGLFNQELRESFQFVLEDNEHMNKLSKILGLDLMEATSRFTICSSGEVGPDAPALSISNGNFSYSQFSEALKTMSDQGELSVFTINDLPIYFNHRSRQAIYFAIVDDGVMIAASKKAILEDAIQGLTELRQPDPTIIERLKWSSEDTKELEHKPVIFLAGVFPEQARKAMEESPLRELAKDMVGYNMTIHLGEKAMFRGRLEMASEESCSRAEKTFELFSRLMKTSMENQKNRPDRLEFFENLDIKAEKKNLLFNLTAPSTLLKQLSENDRKDPNSPRNRARRMREERKEREAKGESSPSSDEDPSKESEPKEEKETDAEGSR